MTLSKYERETIIIYNQAEPNAMVYTHDPKLIAKLRRLHDAVPEKCTRTSMSRTAQHGTLFRKAALASDRHTATLDARQTVNAP